MYATGILTLCLGVMITMRASAAPLPVVLREGKAHVTAAALEREAGIVIKKLPGHGQYVACGAQSCAPVNSVLTDGDTLLVPVAGLGEALHLTATFDESRRHVELVAASRESVPMSGTAKVGSIAPNLRLTKLDGTPVSLAELRGQRVLINSWASW